jgi:hypothetical protein
MQHKNYSPLDFIRQCVREEDGHLYWIERPRSHFADDGAWTRFNRKCPGNECGSLNISKSGYKKYITNILFEGKNIPINRYTIVWAFHNNRWPNYGEMIDHEDRDSTNDKIKNLRLCDKSKNAANGRKHKDGKSGYKGVSWLKSHKKWHASICIKGKRKFLGYYDDPEEAHQAYLKAAKESFGEFYHDGT